MLWSVGCGQLEASRWDSWLLVAGETKGDLSDQPALWRVLGSSGVKTEAL